MNLTRILWPLSFVLAICIALGGQVRAVDVVDLGDTDEIASVAADDFIAGLAAKGMAPSGAGRRRMLSTAPLTIGAGRAAVSELFRPPEA